jgi:hypothetical protein
MTDKLFVMETKMRRKSYSRAERHSMILDKFYSMIDAGKSPELTVYQLAKLMDMTPSPHLRGMLWDLVHEGTLGSRTEHHRKNASKTIFFVPAHLYSFPKRYERTVAINGVQLRL